MFNTSLVEAPFNSVPQSPSTRSASRCSHCCHGVRDLVGRFDSWAGRLIVGFVDVATTATASEDSSDCCVGVGPATDPTTGSCATGRCPAVCDCLAASDRGGVEAGIGYAVTNGLWNCVLRIALYMGAYCTGRFNGAPLSCRGMDEAV